MASKTRRLTTFEPRSYARAVFYEKTQGTRPSPRGGRGFKVGAPGLSPGKIKKPEGASWELSATRFPGWQHLGFFGVARQQSPLHGSKSPRLRRVLLGVPLTGQLKPPPPNPHGCNSPRVKTAWQDSERLRFTVVLRVPCDR